MKNRLTPVAAAQNALAQLVDFCVFCQESREHLKGCCSARSNQGEEELIVLHMITGNGRETITLGSAYQSLGETLLPNSISINVPYDHSTQKDEVRMIKWVRSCHF